MKLKVYGINIDGVHRCIVAEKSTRAAARAMRISYSYMTGWGSETVNVEEIKTAISSPGTVFIKRDDNHDTYRVRE